MIGLRRLLGVVRFAFFEDFFVLRVGFMPLS
jgi:hypothetical protein